MSSLRRRSATALGGIAVACLLLAAVLYANPSDRRQGSSALEAAKTAAPRQERVRCPTALEAGPRAPEEIIRAIRRDVPRTFDFGPNGPRKLTPENTLVRAVGSLVGYRRSSRYYSDLAERLCGTEVALRSWLVVLYFPTSQSAARAEVFEFYAKTRSGWKVWYADTAG